MKILNGDCLELLPQIKDKSIDLILCDLPYGTTKNKWDTIIPFENLWFEYKRIIKDNGAILLFSQMPFGANLIMSNPKMFRYEWIWEKEQGTGWLNAKKMPLKKHENILVFYKHLPTYNPQGLIELDKPKIIDAKYHDYKGYGDNTREQWERKQTNYPTDILHFTHDKDKLHPTQKPVALLEYLIRTYTNEGDVVLDNCMGSGSTGVAAANTNREFIGIELDEKYFNIAKERIEGALNDTVELKEVCLHS